MKITMNEDMGKAVRKELSEKKRTLEGLFTDLQRTKKSFDALSDEYKLSQDEMNKFRKVYIYLEKACESFNELIK